MEKIKENFKKYSTVYIVILLLLVIVGVSYAIFAVTNLSDENTINLGQISMSYTEPDNALVVENALPMGDAEGMAQSNYFEFKVMTHATTDVDDSDGLIIPYEINLGEIAVDSDKQALTKYQIKVYLTKVVGGSEEEVVGPILLSNLSESSTSNLNIYQAKDIHKNAGSEITTTYRLRAWIDSNVNASRFESQIYQYKFNVNINSAVKPISDYLANNWKDYTEEEKEFKAIYTLDTKELPKTKEYNSVVYTKSKEVDISERRNGSVLLGTYQDVGGNKIAIMGQDGGVVAPYDSSSLFDFGTYHRMLKLLDLSNFDTSNVTDMSWMFSDCSGLTELNISSFDTSKVTDMHRMFYNCQSLTELDISSFDTSKVTDMSRMFSSCSSLTNLKLSNFDTSEVTNMSYMFDVCLDLIELNISSFDTSKVTDMNYMFNNCRSLTELNLSNIDTSKVTNMYRMFANCYNLKELNLSNIDTSKVTDMSNMFYYCNSLTELDLSNFNTSQVTSMTAMFSGCSGLTKITVGCDWTTENSNTRAMFNGAGVSEVTVVC